MVLAFFHHSWTIGKNTLKVLNSLKITFYSKASMIKEADELFKSILTPATLQAIVQLIR
jgi:hypothetical protein